MRNVVYTTNVVSAARTTPEDPARAPWRRHGPNESPASVAAVVALVADGAEWCVLPWEPLFIREAVHSVAVITEAPRPAPAVDTGS